MAGKSMRPGGGGRFQAMVASGKSPALAAYIGRKKFGKEKMAKFAAAGRKRAAHSHGNSYGHKYNGHVNEH